jgi:uncharacterized protein YceH (UPF0502 family)
VKIELTANEVRVIGSLMEKSKFTPEQYPLTLNAVTLACNQKSSRDPVTNLDPGTVKHTLRQLEGKHLVSCDENFKARAERYAQRFCNTPFSELQLSPAEFAVICLLMLRGPQTPGELRTRSNRLHTFETNQDVAETLQSLMERQGGPLVARLARKPGRLDSEYVHLFSGPVESAPVESAEAPASSGIGRVDRLSSLEARIEALERELGELRSVLARGDGP